MIAAAFALLGTGMLSSCSLVPTEISGTTTPKSSNVGTGTYVDDQQESDAIMRRLADAVNHHDAPALQSLFSPVAQMSPNFNDRLATILSLFPAGGMSWRRDGNNAAGDGYRFDKQYSEELFSLYTLSDSGNKYELYFADFTIHGNDPAEYLGIYALGVTPFEADPYTASGAKKPFYSWASQFGNWQGKTTGTPGVYLPSN